MKSDLTKLQRILGYQFSDLQLLKEAVMHRSFASENNLNFDNQRLEFLGDSVMQIILSEFVFKKYPDFAELSPLDDTLELAANRFIVQNFSGNEK